MLCKRLIYDMFFCLLRVGIISDRKYGCVPNYFSNYFLKIVPMSLEFKSRQFCHALSLIHYLYGLRLIG